MNSFSEQRQERPKHLHLPRLDPRWYQGFAFVHWTMTIKNRATGWLDARFHQRFREVLLHSLMSKMRAGEVACPVYCLMPDHLHLLLIAWDAKADQRERLMPFLRRQLNAELGGEIRLQKQVYDHVLREKDRGRTRWRGLPFTLLRTRCARGWWKSRQLTRSRDVSCQGIPSWIGVFGIRRSSGCASGGLMRRSGARRRRSSRAPKGVAGARA